jgi:hypothetical protein
VIDVSKKKMKIDKAGNLFEMKNFNMMSPDERSAERKLFWRVIDKKLNKKFKEVSATEIHPYITGLEYQTHGTCHLCGRLDLFI